MARASFKITEWPQLSVALFCLASLSSQAASPPKNDEAVLSLPAISVDLEETPPSDILLERFFQETVASDSIVFDRFSGPASQLSWTRRQADLGYASISQFHTEGARMFSTIAFDSLRTAAAEALPLDMWQDHWQGWLGRLISGTLGNPEEEHIQMTSISYSAVRSSWEKVNERGGIQWGVRPWRTSPYIYFLAHAGRLAGLPLITFEGRSGYSMFGSAKVEARMTLQLPASFRISGGASVDLTRTASNESGANHFAVTLERVLRSRAFAPDSVFYVGFRSGVTGGWNTPRQENQILAGLFKRW
jgi:hypothetical protein